MKLSANNSPIPETKEEFVELLDTYNVWVERTLVVLFERQTAEEQERQITAEDNGVGFTGFDGNILSSLAQQVIDKTERGVPAGKRLTEGQLTKICRKRDKRGVHMLGKYWKQIKSIMDAKTAQKVAVATAAPEEFSAYQNANEAADHRAVAA
jgi:hypothetical protein